MKYTPREEKHIINWNQPKTDTDVRISNDILKKGIQTVFRMFKKLNSNVENIKKDMTQNFWM